MKQEKQDRRSQRTRHLVNAALTEILREKCYTAITVQDLLEKSGIGRSTFYTHYFDKEDVLAAVVEEQLEILRQQLSHRNGGQSILPSLELFRHVQENYPFFQVMVRGHAGEVLWKTGQVLLSRNIEKALTVAYAEKDSPSLSSFGCGGPVPVRSLRKPAQMVVGSRDAVSTRTNGQDLPAAGAAWSANDHRRK